MHRIFIALMMSWNKEFLLVTLNAQTLPRIFIASLCI